MARRQLRRLSLNLIGNETSDWISIHFYYAGNLDEVLIECIFPLTEELSARGLIMRHFFIRYWNGGSHIRLRMWLLKSNSDVVLRYALNSFSEFSTSRGILTFDERAYCRRARILSRHGRDAQGHAEIIEPLSPSGSAERRFYEFDLARYGSELRIVMEAHFVLSSEFARRLIIQSQNEPAARWTLALLLSSVAFYSIKKTFCAGAKMFEQLSIALGGISAPNLSDTSADRGEYVNEIAELLKTGNAFEQPQDVDSVLQFWKMELGRCAELMDSEVGSLGLKREHVIFDLVHLLNNRLGIETLAEAEIYRVISLALVEVSNE